MKTWKGNGNTTTLLFSLKGLEILHQERRGQVKTIVMEPNKHHTHQPINQVSVLIINRPMDLWKMLPYVRLMNCRFHPFRSSAPKVILI